MKYATIRNLVLFMLSAVIVDVAHFPSFSAADDHRAGSTQDVVFPDEPDIPIRDLKFQELNEPFSLQLFAADPKLLKQKYIATVHFVITPFEARLSLPREVRPLYAAVLVNPVLREKSRIPSTVIRQLTQNAPPKRLPAKEIVSLLSNPQHFRFGKGIRQTRRNGMAQADLVFLVLGADVENVKAKARGVVDLYDYGLSYPIQKSHIEKMQTVKNKLERAREKLRAEEPKFGLLEKSLEEYEPNTNETISSETIADLKTQQRLISVDIAGAKGRIDACGRILKRDDVQGRRIAEQVESIKITAEIELVGLEARQGAIDQIVRQATKLRERRAQLAAQQNTVNRLKHSIEGYQRQIRSWDEARQRYLPFAIHKNRIAIRAIKWEPATSGADE